ncbi:MAG TPA: hypothetical protein VHQ66_14570, partial [Myxococcota bacterium]|nr:hypothetical protein [Myxococcota bacterium]
WLSALAAVALAAAAHATVGETTYDPSFRGKYDDYPFGELFTNVRAKNTTIAKGCPYTKRGVLLKGTGPEVDGTFRIFDGDIGPRGFMADTCVDVSRLDTPGAFAGFELGTPVVPVGTAPAAFVFAGVVRQANDSLTAFVATQNGTLPMTLPLPAATPAVKLHFAWDGGAVDVLAGPCDAVTVQPLATDVPLVFDESATFGAGITRADQGDAAGFAFFASGDLYDEAKRDVLLDLQAVIDLENAALADLGAGNPADARTKLEDARKLLEEQGPQVPGSDPPEFEPDLLEKVGALTGLDPAVKADVEKRLTKAAERDAKASAKIGSGNPKDLKEAEKQATKARDEKVRAKAVLETEVVKEGKGAL